MARVFKRLQKQAVETSRTQRYLGWETRLRRLEEALLEANAFQVRTISETCRKDGREPTSQESDFLGSAEDFRKHLLDALKGASR